MISSPPTGRASWADRLVSTVRESKRGPVGGAIGVGVAVSGTAATVLALLGTTGGPVVLAAVGAIAVLAASLTYGVLLRGRVLALEEKVQPAPVQEVRKRLDEALSQIGKLQEQLSGPRLPDKAVQIEGGPLLEAEPELLLDGYSIDPFPVTNYEFSLFLSKEPEWADKSWVERKYGIPYYLCEFRDGKYPEDKWDHPVVWVNWFAAATFCNWRSRRDDLKDVYRFESPSEVKADLQANGWRLPTEAEWEQAARGGVRSETPWLDGPSPILAN